MNLPPEQVDRFYRIWFALLHFVNTRRKLVRPFPADVNKAKVDVADVRKVRDAIWADGALRTEFVERNPAKLPPDDLALVASWEHRVAGPSPLCLDRSVIYTVYTPPHGT
jgi:hypothetical protein